VPTKNEQQRGSNRPAKTLIAITALALASSGCSTMVAYTPKANEPIQSLKYTQGVGTVAEKNESHEIFM
jgi:PBP1b-binding outer membrane lipoprotein LpoB